ncbi:hypothetical protein M413DRAFT_75797 [Hebeloma cylindrosporum]|uniref:NACHT domain-containing protein n=1 Tax=Hebeloma cylindrosporum TaxID=76867 RepID=A0A0C2YCM6_HEBCY|nr:hypothetical protein M413DRAFT_75797 [Hebeloma cylindrosporum h7]
MLLKRLPDVVDLNPAKIALGITKLVLQIRDVRSGSSHRCLADYAFQEVKGNIDTIDRRIISTAEQLRAVKEAMDGWEPDTTEEKQGMRQFETTLEEAWGKLVKLRDQSLARKIAVHEDDKGQIAEIFERINQAREQLVNLLLERLEVSHIADHKSELEGEKRQLLRRAVCTPGTRVRILENITSWANDISPGSQSVYWLTGQAGSGKTTIAYTIARRFEFANDADDTIVLGGNFFCSRQFEETRFATRIVRTIVYHLALRWKVFAEALSEFDTIHQNVSVQLERLLIAPWKQARLTEPSNPPNFLVIIDALDEIERGGGSGFLRDLLDVINKHRLPGLKFFATSRPDPNLVTRLQSFEDKQFYRLEQVPIEEAETDITIYLNTNLSFFVGTPEMEKLIAQAAGLFIYAATVVKYLEGYTPPEQKQRLDMLPSLSVISQTPETLEEETPLLDGLYFQVLSDAFHGFKGNFFVQRLHILHTFLCSAERTSTSLVANLLFSGKETNFALSHTAIADSVFACLHAVLYTADDRVLSYHKSFTDFMFNQNRAGKFWCNQAEHHRLLTESCFRVMNTGLKFNIANISSSFLLDCDNSELPDAVRQNISPVLSYACRSWDQHFLGVKLTDSDALFNILSEFLKLHVLFWIEALNLLGLRGLCNLMLQRVYKCVTNVMGSAVNATVASSNGRFIISGSEDGSVRVWDASTGEILKVLDGHTKRVRSVKFSNDDRFIISGSVDKSVRVWDASTGETLKVLEGHTRAVSSVEFSSDDRFIISGSWDKSVRVWDASTGETLKVLEGHTHQVTSVVFSSDSRFIISGSWDKSVRVWDASTGETLKVLEGHTNRVTSVAFSSDDRFIISGSYDKLVRVWDASTGETLKVLGYHTKRVTSVAFSSDDRFIISGSYDKSTLKVLEGHIRWVTSVVFSSDNRFIISGSWDESVRVWDASTGETLKVLEGHTHWVTSVVFSSDNRFIISGSEDGSVRVWDASTGETLKVLVGRTWAVTSVVFSSDDRFIISGSKDGSVRVWDASTGETLKVLVGHTWAVTSVVFSSDNRFIISGSDDGSVRVWDASTGETLKVLEGHTYEVTSVALSSDNRFIISGSNDNSVRVWDASTGEILKNLKADPSSSLQHTGWLLSPHKADYLMFVPLSVNLPDSSTLPQPYAASVDFTPSTLGSEWHKCFVL